MISDDTIKKSDCGFLLHALNGDHCTFSNHSAAICHRMFLALKSTGAGHFGAKFREKGVTDVSPPNFNAI